MVAGYFLDAWALIEIARKNPKYDSYARGENVTTHSALYELAFKLMEAGEPDKARWALETFWDACVAPARDDYLEAAAFRLRWKDKNGYRFSYVDALGYILSARRRVPFLTGDRDFEGFPGVVLVR